MIYGKVLGAGGAGGIPPGPWSLTDVAFNGGLYDTALVIDSEETIPNGIFFKPDGTKMYVAGDSGNDVSEYDLSTPWELTTAVYLRAIDIGSQELTTEGLFFKPDGTKMYIVGSAGDEVNEYNLSTAWDVTTAVYLQLFSVAAQDITPRGVFFKPDGAKMYVIGDTGDSVYEYDLSTPWSVTSAVFLQLKSVSTQDTGPQDISFKPDGTKMYVMGDTGDDVNEYDLSTPWDISTAVFLQLKSVNVGGSFAVGLFFKPDGTKMYTLDSYTDAVYQYTLATAWDVSSAYISPPATEYFSVAAQDTAPYDISFKPDGTKMYVLGDSGNDVNEYDLSTAWDITTAVFLQLFSIATQQTSPTGFFFKPDGTKMYVSGNSGDEINEYDLSTPWSVTSAVFLQLFVVAAQTTTPTGVFFKPDGTKMYVSGYFTSSVNEYNLSTPWDISTAVFLQLKTVDTQEGIITDVFFKPDGAKMYVIGYSGDEINSYNLSTPWDITSATPSQVFSVSTQDLTPQGFFFKPDGTKIYIVGWGGKAIFSYDIT